MAQQLEGGVFTLIKAKNEYIAKNLVGIIARHFVHFDVLIIKVDEDGIELTPIL